MINVLAILVAFSILAMHVWRRAYPRPYKDVPYDKQSASRLFGDIPDMIKFAKEGNDPAQFIPHRCRQLNSPIIQLFLAPFSSPLIFVDDVGEVENIVFNHTKRLDRAPITINTLLPLFPFSSMLKRTTPEWRAQRRLWKDTMSNDFLRRIAAPQMYETAMQLVDLFQLKIRIGSGRPFSVRTDFNLSALDVIWVAFLGSELHGIRDEICGMRNHDGSIQQPVSKDCPAAMPSVVKGELYQAIEYLSNTLQINLASPLPGWYNWLLRQLPRYKRCWALKEKTINGLIQSARARFNRSCQTDGTRPCAIDMVLQREQSAITRPNASAFVIPPTDLEIHDELFMLLIAVFAPSSPFMRIRNHVVLILLLNQGHETTATTLCWCAKFLTNNPAAQAKLRESLRTALPRENPPTLEDILNTDMPYLDATLEECIRLADVVPRIVRVALDDTEILGHDVPKGAQIMCTTSVSANTLGECRRGGTNSYQEDKKQPVSETDSRENMHLFSPERWLNHAGAFNPRALRRMAFSGGPRGCFGKRFAMQELRIILAVLVMKFRFESIPGHLNSMRSDPGALREPRQTFVRLTNLAWDDTDERLESA